MHLHLQQNRSNLSFFENYNYCKNLWFPTILQVVWRVKKIPLRFNKESTTCHVPACFSIRGEKCNVTLPWWQNFWIRIKGSFSNDDRDGNKNGMKAIEQLCTCRTLFGTFLRKPNKSIEGKTEISGGKSNVKRHTVWGASEKLGCDVGRCNFLLFLVCSADLDVFCGGPFSHYVTFHSFIFKHKISTQHLYYYYYQDERYKPCYLVAGHIIRKTNVSILFPPSCRMISGGGGGGYLG